MADPFTAAIVLIGTTLEIAKQGMAANEARRVAELNAEMAREDAATVREQAREEEARFREEGEKLKGTQRTIVGGSAAKMGEGTPLDIMKETTARIERDALKIRKEGERIATRYEQEAGNYQRIAGQIVPASLLGMGSTLFSRLSNLNFTKKTTWGGAGVIPRRFTSGNILLGY